METQLLFDLGPTFRGATIEAQDVPRLTSQYERVKSLMLDGKWRTLRQIATACNGSEPSVSARLRDLRREGYTVERERVAGGLFAYRVYA
jgi:biotin operon repressor